MSGNLFLKEWRNHRISIRRHLFEKLTTNPIPFFLKLISCTPHATRERVSCDVQLAVFFLTEFTFRIITAKKSQIVPVDDPVAVDDYVSVDDPAVGKSLIMYRS
jgi:hypothetical protein